MEERHDEEFMAENLSDEFVFEEAARRLRARYRKRYGSEFRYGSFDFIFHDGRFQSVEERPRSKGYISHLRLVKP
ncbi:MAG: hypothetical protein JST16_05225 [Bdellovibrionales bacterium]|nr:hypothetical protein [Bdellovibrionales bacterium]